MMLKNQNVDVETKTLVETMPLVRVVDAVEEIVRHQRVVFLEFQVIRGPMPFTLRGRFVFGEKD